MKVYNFIVYTCLDSCGMAREWNDPLFSFSHHRNRESISISYCINNLINLLGWKSISFQISSQSF